MGRFPRSETKCRAIAGTYLLFGALENGGDDFAGAAVITEFTKVDALPCAQVELTVCDGDFD